MNVKRIKHAIKLMKKAKNLNMVEWQNHEDSGGLAHSVKELHACGNSACFAGYVGISKPFKKAGGRVNSLGDPLFNTQSGSLAISDYFDISYDLADNFVSGGEFEWKDDVYVSKFYNKQWKDVTPEDVIKKLEMVLSGELI